MTSACCPARRAPVVMQPEAVRATTATANRARRLVACGIVDYVDTPRNAELEHLIGYALIFLQVRKSQGRIAPLGVARDESPNLEGNRVDGHHQVVVIRLTPARGQLQREGPRNGGVNVGGRKIARDVA